MYSNMKDWKMLEQLPVYPVLLEELPFGLIEDEV